jgi:hypothetical protein
MNRPFLAAVGLIAAVVLSTTGCKISQGDPSKMLSIEIDGIPDPATCDRVLKQIDEAQQQSKKWTDGKSNVKNWSGAGRQMKIEVTPVSDVDAFIKQITFGDVTSVDGRTVKVTYRQGTGDAAAATRLITQQSGNSAPLTIKN